MIQLFEYSYDLAIKLLGLLRKIGVQAKLIDLLFKEQKETFITNVEFMDWNSSLFIWYHDKIN